MSCRLQKAKKLLQGFFVYRWMYKSEGVGGGGVGVKYWMFLGKYRFKVIKVKECDIK